MPSVSDGRRAGCAAPRDSTEIDPRDAGSIPSMLVLPLFVVPGRDAATAIPSMPGVMQWSVDRASARRSRAPSTRGVRAVILFGIPESEGRRREPCLARGRSRPARAAQRSGATFPS